jgi:hypothetical protein
VQVIDCDLTDGKQGLRRESVDKAGQPIPLVTTCFYCTVCNHLAGTISLVRGNDTFIYKVEDFAGVFTFSIKPELYDKVFLAIKNSDIKALYFLNYELVPFFCKDCDRVYCLQHWSTWDEFDSGGWFDCLRGCCGNGHERILMD